MNEYRFSWERLIEVIIVSILLGFFCYCLSCMAGISLWWGPGMGILSLWCFGPLIYKRYCIR